LGTISTDPGTPDPLAVARRIGGNERKCKRKEEKRTKMRKKLRKNRNISG